VEKDCQVCKLNKEDAVDHSRRVEMEMKSTGMGRDEMETRQVGMEIKSMGTR